MEVFWISFVKEFVFVMVWILLFVDEESKGKGGRLLLSINLEGHSDDEEDASIFFLDSQRTCICRVGCWLSWLKN